MLPLEISSEMSLLLPLLSPDVMAILPSGYLLKKQVRHNLKILQAATYSPTSAADIIIPADYQKDSAGNLLLQDESSPRCHRILVSSTDLVLDAVNTSTIDNILADRTFKSFPPLFNQAWIIRARIESYNLSILYASEGDNNALNRAFDASHLSM